MPQNLYALIIGINAYPYPVPLLHGCVNDANAIESYLQGRVAGECFQVHVRKLLDQQATRQAVIDGFRQHLCQARGGDVALFYYSGHGSQEPAPPEFWDIEPDHRNETLVCWDSRQAEGRDLADKELGYLIYEAAQQGAHVVVVLDCCHSGSGTRDAYPTGDVRWAPADERPRPLSDYLFAGQRDIQSGGWSNLPQGRHVLLAACRPEQRAREYDADGKVWGTFSYFLRQALEGISGELTYHDLFKQAQARTLVNAPDQAPQLEASHPEDLDRPFLGGAVRPRPQVYTASHNGFEWVLDGGALHGLQSTQGQEATSLALFPLEASGEALRDLTQAVAQAILIEALPEKSRLQITQGSLDRQRSYKALVTGLPLPPLGVLLEGDEAGLALVRQALAGGAPGGGASLYVQEASEGARLRLLAKQNTYTITYPSQERPLAARLSGYDMANARQAVERLEHIARWLRTRDLRNPASQLPVEGLRVWITLPGASQAIPPDALRFEYRQVDGEWQQPSYDLHLENQSGRVLYVSVLGLWESFAIETIFPNQPVVRLGPGESFKLQLWGSVPDEVWQQGVTDRQDILQLIACTSEFDASLLTQGRLDAERHGGARRGLSAAGSTLERLMQRVQVREVSAQGPCTRYSDWMASGLSVTTHRPMQQEMNDGRK